VAVITVNLPSAEEEELIRRFTVNKNYLQALSHFLIYTYGKQDKLYSGIKKAVDARPQYMKIQRAASVDVEQVRRYLLLGWTSEIQLHVPETMGFDAIVGYANAWAPVHAYYSVFGGLQAWFAANGMVGIDDHTATLNSIANMIEQRDLFPEPWNLLAEGCPMRGEKKHVNVPSGVDVTSHVEVLSIPAPFGGDPTFWLRYGTWLRTTREARLTAREDKWKKDNKKLKVSPQARTQIATALSPTSLFDCFWRMRLKSNYGNIDPYLVKHITQGDHMLFNSALCTVTRATLGLLELYIMRRVGRAEYEKIARDFVSKDSAGLSKRTLQARATAFGLTL
jgi:hypothetical protein